MHLEKFWPLILFALIGVIRTLIAKSEGSPQGRNSPSESSTPPPAAENETDTDRMRKFLEALGQPSSAMPPPKVRPRVPAEMRRVFNPLPPLTTKPLMPQRAKPKLIAPQTVIPTPADPTSVEVIPENAYEAKLAVTAKNEDSFRRFLDSPNSLRQAFILREVLGAPRGLRPLDHCGSA